MGRRHPITNHTQLRLPQRTPYALLSIHPEGHSLFCSGAGIGILEVELKSDKPLAVPPDVEQGGVSLRHSARDAQRQRLHLGTCEG